MEQPVADKGAPHADAFESQGTSAFFYAFFGAVFVLIFALFILRELPLPSSLLDNPRGRGILDELPPDEIAAFKLRHALQVPRYDVGLFGNSRILMIGSSELRLGDIRVYNFAVPGQSIRQSIRLLRALQGFDKAPKTAIISMDYVALGLPGGAGVFPGAPSRWINEAKDAVTAWHHAGLHSAVVSLINAVPIEAEQMALTFNHNYVLAKLKALLGSGSGHGNYRPDGSRQETVPSGRVRISALQRRADDYPQLESDFAQLAAIRKTGTRIIIYESPVAPQLMVEREQDLSPQSRSVRRRFHAACAKFSLECHKPPLLDGSSWFDRDHAPAALLATWLRPIVKQGN